MVVEDTIIFCFFISEGPLQEEPPITTIGKQRKIISKQSKQTVKSPKTTDDLSMDIERTVRQLEKRLEEEDMASHQSPRGGHQRNFVLPEVTEELGTG